jgi:PAS domain S-box-containing protein
LLDLLDQVGLQLGTVIQRKRAEEALRLSEASLAEAQRIAHIGNWDWKVAEDSLSWSDELHRIYGIDRSEFAATYDAFLAVVHPEDRDFVEAEVQAALSGGESYDSEFRLLLEDGTVKYIESKGNVFKDEQGNVVRMIGTNQDITERKLTEQELRESEERYRAIFDNAADAVYVVDPETTKIVDCNDAAVRMLDYTRDELRHMQIGDIDHRHDEAEIRQRQAQVQATGSATFDSKHRTKSGDLLDVHISIRAIILRKRHLQICIVRDVSERKRLEAQLQQSQKLEAVGHLAAGVAHDFNNLLAIILGHVELMESEISVDNSQQSDLEEIREAGERASGLTRQLLAFSRQETIQPRIVELNEVVTKMERMLGRLIGADVNFSTQLGPEVGAVLADPTQLEQIVLNLAVNARDAMPTGGDLIIETSVVASPAGEEPPELPGWTGRFLELSVRDTGVGMAEEVRRQIFDPFFTTKERGKGTGLGMATVYGIVQRCLGRIDVESTPGKGTSMRVQLPEVHPSDSSKTLSAKTPGVPRGETILVAEDDASLRSLICRALRNAGYRVLEAKDAEQALARCEDAKPDIDLLLTDVVMPGRSGSELARELVSHIPGLRVLFISGYTDDATMRYGVERAEVALLDKPFTPRILLQKLREVLD